jgi:hypothetical protein
MAMDAVVMIILPWRPFLFFLNISAVFQRVHNLCMVKGGEGRDRWGETG